MQQISKVVFSLFRGSPQHEDWVLSCLQGAWPALVGERMARACSPVAFTKGRLVIQVVDAAWAGALTGMKQEILSRLRTATNGEIHDLAFTNS